MGTSHTVFEHGGFALAIDEQSARFSLDLGTGFQSSEAASCVNIEMLNLSLGQLKLIAARIQNIIGMYDPTYFLKVKHLICPACGGPDDHAHCTDELEVCR